MQAQRASRSLQIPSFVLVCLGLLVSSASTAAPPLAELEMAANLFTFQAQVPYGHVRVTITGPDGFQIERTFDAAEAPAVALPGTDGLYKYELRFSPVIDAKVRGELAAAREAGIEVELGGSREADERTVQRGSFSVADGALVPEQFELEPRVVLTNADGVIRNSLCVGLDCPNSPAFSDSTILMMENNTRIKFGDTSVAPFPNNDWEIEANSNLSGGANYLGFNDCGTADDDGGCATDLVFAVEAGARQSALHVESDGDVGLGTSNPVLDLHIVTGNTPAIRLDQDGSSGFAPQAWDIAGNETSFFIRDVTSGSRLPFRIQPGAPSNSLFINLDGRIGVGTASPTESIHIVTSAQNTGRLRFNDGNQWDMGSGSGDTFIINDNNGDAAEMTVFANGNVTITGTLTTAGSCSIGCDRVFEEANLVESIDQHAELMWANRHLPAVGPTPESGPFNLSKMTTGMLNELEKAHIYIEQLHGSVQSLTTELQAKDSELAALHQRLALIEQKLAGD